jgi:hypothetical protein
MSEKREDKRKWADLKGKIPALEFFEIIGLGQDPAAQLRLAGDNQDLKEKIIKKYVLDVPFQEPPENIKKQMAQMRQDPPTP